jgi:hypothetical protein
MLFKGPEPPVREARQGNESGWGMAQGFQRPYRVHKDGREEIEDKFVLPSASGEGSQILT